MLNSSANGTQFDHVKGLLFPSTTGDWHDEEVGPGPTLAIRVTAIKFGL